MRKKGYPPIRVILGLIMEGDAEYGRTISRLRVSESLLLHAEVLCGSDIELNGANAQNHHLAK